MFQFFYHRFLSLRREKVQNFSFLGPFLGFTTMDLGQKLVCKPILRSVTLKLRLYFTFISSDLEYSLEYYKKINLEFPTCNHAGFMKDQKYQNSQFCSNLGHSSHVYAELFHKPYSQSRSFWKLSLSMQVHNSGWKKYQ